MIFSNKKFLFLLIFSQLILTTSSGQTFINKYKDSCDSVSLTIAGKNVADLSSDIQDVTLALMEEDIKKQVGDFFKEVERSVKSNGRIKYSSPNLKIKGFTQEQNQLLDEILLKNANTIVKQKLYLTNEVSTEIYNVPNLDTRKYNISPKEFDKIYKSQFKDKAMGIFTVTHGASLGAVIGWVVHNTVDNSHEA